jgi:hypothetical protein
MKRRGCFLFLPLLALAGNDAQAVPVQMSALQVQVYDYTGLNPAALHEFITRTQEILTSSGVSAEVDGCARGAMPCEGHSGSSRQIVIRVVADQGKKRKNVRLETLGESFAGHGGGTYATIFLRPAEEEAVDANLPRMVVLAYAAVHEIGHLLLGEAHSPQGLMKAAWDVNDFQAMAQNGFHFSPGQRLELSSRYSAAPQAEGGQDTVVAVRH